MGFNTRKPNPESLFRLGQLTSIGRSLIIITREAGPVQVNRTG
jgi:hypothetical protein